MGREPLRGRVSLAALVQACPHALRPLWTPDPTTEIEVESFMHRPGLLLAGFRPRDEVERHILVFGKEEFDFLNQHPRQRRAWLKSLWSCRPPMIIVGADATPPADFLEGVQTHRIPTYASAAPTHQVLAVGFRWLERLIATWFRVTGNLVEIFGLGVMITGPSGVGKSECTLDLLARGHRLVADDAIEVTRFQDGTLVGRAPPENLGLMEIRGLGILDVRTLFGVLAVLEEKTIDLVIRLTPPTEPWSRLGTQVETYTLPYDLGTIPMLRLPVVPGRNLASLAEVAVRWYTMRTRGIRVEEDFLRRVDARAAGLESNEA